MGLKDNKKQVHKNHHFSQSLYHALCGIKTLLLTERNFRIHLVTAIIVLILSLCFHVSVFQFLWLCLAIFMVLIAEIINSIVERIVDLLVQNQYSQLAKQAKDIAAGCVLMTSLLAVIIGLIIFGPFLIEMVPWR
ncbi:diacylglycerol kinase family protein [Lactobacillaceae bacterium Scapto_B20]